MALNKRYKKIKHEIDEITCKKTIDGEVFYLCRWNKCSEYNKTWESESIIQKHYENKLIEFQQKQQELITQIKRIKKRDLKVTTMNALGLFEHKHNEPCKYGFSRGLIAEKILTAIYKQKEVHFLIKWKNFEELDIVSSREARQFCPNVVIDFYERNFYFENTSKSKI